MLNVYSSQPELGEKDMTEAKAVFAKVEKGLELGSYSH
jgi:hypothetical protein